VNSERERYIERGRESVCVRERERGARTLTGDGAHNGDKLVEILSSPDGNGSTGKEGEDPEKVLLPLDEHVVLARAGKEAVLHDTDGWEELQGDRKHDGDRVQALDRLHQVTVLGQVQEDDGLSLGAKGSIGQRAEGSEEDSDADHDARQHLGELFGLLHRLCNGDDQTDTLEREYCRGGWGIRGIRVGKV